MTNSCNCHGLCIYLCILLLLCRSLKACGVCIRWKSVEMWLKRNVHSRMKYKLLITFDMKWFEHSKMQKKIHDSMRVFSWETHCMPLFYRLYPWRKKIVRKSNWVKNTEINKILFVPGKNSFMTSVKVHRVNLPFSKDRTNNNQKMYEIVKIFVFIWLPYLEKERRSETLG